MAQKFNILKNNSVDILKWDSLVQSSPYSNPFQTRHFYNFCNSTKGHKSIVLVVENDNDQYIALCVVDFFCFSILKRDIPIRAIVHGGPLLKDYHQHDGLAVLLENLNNEIERRVIFTEIRNSCEYSIYKSVYSQFKWDYQPWFNIRNNLNNKNLKTLLSSFKYNRRRETKLTIKQGLTFEETKDLQDISKIYKLLLHLYKEEIGLPLASLQYFIDLLNSGLLIAFKVTDDKIVVGGSFCLLHNSEAIYTYYYCGKRDYRIQTFPTHLAVLAAIEYGVKNGMKYLDFMGAGRVDEEYGVRNYKLGFGGELIETGRFLKIENKLIYHFGVRFIGFMKNRKRKMKVS